MIAPVLGRRTRRTSLGEALTASFSLLFVLVLTSACGPRAVPATLPQPPVCYAFAVLLDTTQAQFRPRLGNPVHLPPRAGRFDRELVGPMTAHRRANPDLYARQYRVVLPANEPRYLRASNYWVPSGDSIFVVWGAPGFWSASLVFAQSLSPTIGRGYTSDDMGPKFGYDVQVQPTDCAAYLWSVPHTDSVGSPELEATG